MWLEKVLMVEIPISEFKAKCLAILEQVRKTREPIRITRHGKPVAEVVPTNSIVDRAAWLKSIQGTTTIKGDLIAPAHDSDEWEMLRD
jgi:prevent-host-death family protein